MQFSKKCLCLFANIYPGTLFLSLECPNSYEGLPEVRSLQKLFYIRHSMDVDVFLKYLIPKNKCTRSPILVQILKSQPPGLFFKSVYLFHILHL